MIDVGEMKEGWWGGKYELLISLGRIDNIRETVLIAALIETFTNMEKLILQRKKLYVTVMLYILLKIKSAFIIFMSVYRLQIEVD